MPPDFVCKPDDAVFVDYVTRGPRNASLIARGQTRLQGVVIADDQGTRHITGDIATAIRAFGDRRCVFHDRCFAQAIELFNDLPTPATVEDIRIMGHILDEPLPSPLSQKPSRDTNGDPVAASRNRAEAIHNTFPALQQRLTAQDGIRLYRDVELPAIWPTLAMVTNGVRINVPQLEQLVQEQATQLQRLQQRLRQVAGREINVQWDQDVARFVYKEQRLPVLAYTRNGNPSTRDEDLQSLVTDHPEVETLLEARRLVRLHGEAGRLLRCVQGNGLVHPYLDPLGTATGRFSCSDPNLHGLSQELRGVVIADPGHVFLEADLSQWELRVLAHLSGDERLITAFQQDIDVHRRTAAVALGNCEDAITAAERAMGKTLNFQILYGASPDSVAHHLGVSPEDGQRFLNNYFQEYPQVGQWINSVHDFALNTGCTQTLYGRRRSLRGLHTAGHNQALRQAVNTAVQGTAAELMKMMLARLVADVPGDVRMLLTVHDSVLFQVPIDRLEDARAKVIEILETPPNGFIVPIRVTTKSGMNWAGLT